MRFSLDVPTEAIDIPLDRMIAHRHRDSINAGTSNRLLGLVVFILFIYSMYSMYFMYSMLWSFLLR